MKIELNYRSGKAAYVQIAEQIKYAAASGLLRPGESLPGIRPLSEKLQVNRNTVLKAYSELENDGVIEKVPGIGCIIAKNNSPLKKSVRNQLLAEAIDAALVHAYQLQTSEEEFIALVQNRAKAFYQNHTKNQEDKS